MQWGSLTWASSAPRCSPCSCYSSFTTSSNTSKSSMGAKVIQGAAMIVSNISIILYTVILHANICITSPGMIKNTSGMLYTFDPLGPSRTSVFYRPVDSTFQSDQHKTPVSNFRNIPFMHQDSCTAGCAACASAQSERQAGIIFRSNAAARPTLMRPNLGCAVTAVTDLEGLGEVW